MQIITFASHLRILKMNCLCMPIYLEKELRVLGRSEKLKLIFKIDVNSQRNVIMNT